MENLEPEECEVYIQIDGKQAERDFTFLTKADEIITDLDTPLGKRIMTFLYNYRAGIGELLYNSIHGDKSVPETLRIEFKQINMLIQNIEDVVIGRERKVSKIKQAVVKFQDLTKAVKRGIREVQ